jgi:hypothetical protein
MEAILTKKDLHSVVFHTIPKGTTAEKIKEILDERDATKMASARAELIIHVSDDQLVHMRSMDPREIWQTLERVHVTQGFATSLSLRRQFLTGRKNESESISTWIGRVQTLAYRLQDAGIDVSDQDKILALTLGLPAKYEAVIINFDATPTDQLTWNAVVTRLLNEEVRQEYTPPGDHEGALVAAIAHSSRPSRPLSEINCHLCDEKGHYKANCPLRQPLTRMIQRLVAAGEGPVTAATLAIDDPNNIAF